MHEPVVGGIVFNPEAYSGCSRCMDSCQPKAWSLSGKRTHHGVSPAKFISGKCVTCGTCYYYCPQLGALTLAPQSHRKTPERSKRLVAAA